MNVTLIVLSLLAGAVLCGAYLYGLWWTVRWVAATGNRSLLAISFVVRAALLLLAFWGMLRFGPWSLIATLAGFLITRIIITGLMGNGGEKRDDPVT